MFNLLFKDIRIQFLGDSDFKKKLVKLFILILLMGALAFVIAFIFSNVIKKVDVYKGAATAYLTLFLAIVSILMIIMNVLRAYKLFFNKKDIEILTTEPVTNSQIIGSKMIYILVMHYVTSLVFVYPIFISYALNQGRSALFYFITIFYPLLSFLFEGGIALLLVYPFKLIIDYLKKHLIIQFIVSLVLMVLLAVLYSKVLSLFMTLVVNNNINQLFTTSAIKQVSKITSGMVPIVFLVQFFLGVGVKILPYICIAAGIFLLGITLTIFAFNYFRNVTFTNPKKKLKEAKKIPSVPRMLIKKELIVLFKDSNNIFSFSGLLIIQPFLMYMVISSINGVFRSGSFQFYSLIIPNIVEILDIVLIMLFTIIINTGANSYISNEMKTIRVLKTIPIEPEKQLLFKVLVPFVLSLLSLIVSTLVLIICKTISPVHIIFGFLLSLTMLVVFEIVSLREEIKIRANKPKSNFLSTIYAYIIPVLFLGISMLFTYNKVNVIVPYILTLVIIFGSAIPFIINYKQKIRDDFLDLDMIN